MKKNNFSLLFFALLCISAFSGCKQTQTAYIQPPIADWNPKFKIFKFLAENGDTLHLPTGTTIVIPPNILADSLNKIVSGEVEIHYREFHDAMDIWLSGIPMTYDSAGSQNFETAGMFEMRAFQAQKTLQIVKGSKIKIELASYQNNGSYSNYFLDTTKRNWNFTGYSPANPNKRKVDELERIAKQEQNVEKSKNKFFVFNYYSMLDVYFGEYVEAIPNYRVQEQAFKNRKNKTVKNKIENYGVKWINISSGTEMIDYGKSSEYVNMLVWEYIGDRRFPSWCENTKNFNTSAEGNPYSHVKYSSFTNYFEKETTDTIRKMVTKKLIENGKKIKKQVEEISYIEHKQQILTNIVLKKMTGNTYSVSIESDKGKKFTITLQPVMRLRDLMELDTNHFKAIFGAELIKLQKEKEMANLMADVIRSFEIDGFGIYNCDRLLSLPEKASVIASFTFDKPVEKGIVTDILMMPSSNAAVMHNYESMWKELPVLPDQNMKMFTMLPNKKVAYFPSESYAAIDFQKLKQNDKQPFTFKMTVLNQSIASPSDLRQLLGISPSKADL